MRRYLLGSAVAALLACVSAQAAPAYLTSGIYTGEVTLEQVQFYVWGGRHYCWYYEGWHGPGWYWCGYHHRRGLGWGGPEGWQGWRHEERRRHY